MFKPVVDKLKSLGSMFDDGVGLRADSEWSKLNLALCSKNKNEGILEGFLGSGLIYAFTY